MHIFFETEVCFLFIGDRCLPPSSPIQNIGNSGKPGTPTSAGGGSTLLSREDIMGEKGSSGGDGDCDSV